MPSLRLLSTPELALLSTMLAPTNAGRSVRRSIVKGRPISSRRSGSQGCA
jgi:hypothetical protein